MKKQIEYDKETLDWINSENGDVEFRKRVVEINKKHNVDIVVFEPGCFDHGIKRVGYKRDGYVAVYDYDKTVEALAEDYFKTNNKGKKTKSKKYTHEDARQDAIDWIEYNTIRSIPYMGTFKPKMVYTDENGRERRV